jgi:hypothetical protein
LLDHYVFSSVPSDFVYRVKDENMEGFSISYEHVHRHLFANNKFENLFKKFKSNSLGLYRKTIYGRVNNRRKEHTAMITSQRQGKFKENLKLVPETTASPKKSESNE